MDLTKVEHRSVIKFLTKEGKAPKDIHERMSIVGSGRPVEASDQEMCDKLESAIPEDRRTKVSVLAHELGISEGTVVHMIHEKLHMSKVSSRWVPRMLTPAQKNRSDICKENLEFSKQIGETFFPQNSNW